MAWTYNPNFVSNLKTMGSEVFATSLLTMGFITQIREQMLGGTFLWYEKSILGCWLWVGLWNKRFGPIMSNFWGLFFHFFGVKKKGYLPNLLERWLLPQIFVFWVRDFKFWLLAYFFYFVWLCKFSEILDNIYIDILQGSPLWCFLFL